MIAEIDRFIRWIFQTPEYEDRPEKPKNTPVIERGIDYMDFDNVDYPDFRTDGYFDAIVAVPALNVRRDPTVQSRVMKVVYKGDQLVVQTAFIGPLYSEEIKYPSKDWVSLIAVNGRRSSAIGCYIRIEHLKNVDARLPFEALG